jgi:formamidopyrimidine-DNA glycosylase
VLGPDPLRTDADPDRAWRRIHRATRPIAALLMDQTILSGVGNVPRGGPVPQPDRPASG